MRSGLTRQLVPLPRFDARPGDDGYMMGAMIGIRLLVGCDTRLTLVGKLDLSLEMPSLGLRKVWAVRSDRGYASWLLCLKLVCPL